MTGEVTGFFRWVAERLKVRRDPVGAYRAEQDRVASDFRSTTVPLYGLPPDYQCFRSITWGSDVPMRGGLPVGSEVTQRFGLTHALPTGCGLEVDSVQDESAAQVERFLHYSRWGPGGTQVSVERPHDLLVDGQGRTIRLLLPWEQESPVDWACAVQVEGCVLKVKAQGFPLSDVQLVRITDVNPYLGGR